MTSDFKHGGALDYMRTAFPGVDDSWIDLSTGINPWPLQVGTFSNTSLEHLPSSEMFERCRLAMAGAFGAAAHAVLPAPGSELLIRLLPNVINPKSVAVLAPSYGDHQKVWRQHCRDIRQVADPLVLAEEVDCVVVCNPNNPDGRTFGVEQLEAARKTLAAKGGWLIVDEAYCDLTPAQSLGPKAGSPGLIVLRSMGKFYGLAGVRLGALMAPPAVINAMQELLGVWSVSGIALEIGVEAYENREWQSATRSKLSAARKRVDQLFSSAQIEVTGGTDLYRYIDCEDAHALWKRLAEAGIYTRRFDWTRRNLRIGLPFNADAESRLAAALGVTL